MGQWKINADLAKFDAAVAEAKAAVAAGYPDGGMSLRTDELDESEALRDSIVERRKPGH